MDGSAATIRDVAKLAGVAVSTASRALGNGSASEKTRLKVQRAAEALNFVPNPAAKQLTSGKSNIVAIVVPEEPEFMFHDAFVSGMVSQLATSFASVQLLPFLVLTAPHDAQGFLKLLRGSGASGIVVTSFHYSKQLAAVLETYGKPVIFIGKPNLAMHYPYVDVDNYQGGYDAGKLLRRRGCEHIAVIAGPDDMQTPPQRTKGIIDALAVDGLEPVAIMSGKYGTEHGEVAMRRILDEHPEIDGVFAHSDQIASGALRALSGTGRMVPDDVALVGFDDFRVAEATTPKLTTFAQPLAMMAEEATTMLRKRLETGVWEKQATLFPAQLVRRESA